MSTWCSKHVEAWNKLIVKQILFIKLVNYWDKKIHLRCLQMPRLFRLGFLSAAIKFSHAITGTWNVTIRTGYRILCLGRMATDLPDTDSKHVLCGHKPFSINLALALTCHFRGLLSVAVVWQLKFVATTKSLDSVSIDVHWIPFKKDLKTIDST